ncbi:predicted protein [Naegleria gruberi]|uniref:Predicted protein n=1 Tax=Naegleria gruberi TaxID=5762 RepID=D2VI44_NAEGR|nr:uncharacterized protein NAEGRDRAFT_68555 [Naegleria gruberi]EFC43452.1 predicted protein [Naegleria gruberi]|eukprot:XP_002676196.1 predicted protein [Naegleria gruberi strain NEG-M]
MEKQAFVNVQANSLEFLAKYLEENRQTPMDHVIINNELYSIIASGGNRGCTIYKTTNFESSTKWQSTLIGEFELIKENQSDDDLSQMYCLSIDRNIYIITISNNSMSRIHRISIQKSDEEENYVETLFEDSGGDFIGIDPGLIADSKRNCLYFMFGLTVADSAKKNITRFDINTGSFSVIGELDREFYCLSSTFWKDRYIILVGGLTNLTPSSDILAFDVEQGIWKQIYRAKSMPVIYPRYMSGITMVSNNYASQFHPEIPKDSNTDTIFIYGGFLDYEVEVSDHSRFFISRPSHEVILHYLKESEWIDNMESDCEKRIPISLTDICTPEDRKLEKLHIRRIKSGIEDDDAEDSNEFKILPTCTFSTILPLKIRGRQELLIFRNTEQVLKIQLFHNNPFHRESMNKNPDVSILFSE